MIDAEIDVIVHKYRWAYPQNREGRGLLYPRPVSRCGAMPGMEHRWSKDHWSQVSYYWSRVTCPACQRAAPQPWRRDVEEARR